jgi:hypothetical protein
MVSTLEVPVRAQRAELELPPTGSAKRVSVRFPLVYTGSAPAKVLAFLAASAGEAVSVELSYPDRPAGPYRAVVKVTGARIKLRKEGEKVAVLIALVLSREDTREPRELLEFLLDAAHAQALELDLRAKLVQDPLPFEEPGEDGKARAPRARGPRRTTSSPIPG